MKPEHLNWPTNPARLAGFMFLFVNIIYICHMFIQGTIVIPGDVPQTAKNIVENEALFRFNIGTRIVTTIGGILLALSLYILLKPINRNLALIAVGWRFAEAALGGAHASNDFFVLYLLSGADYLNAFTVEQTNGLAKIFLISQYGGLYISIILSCTGAMIFNFLLWKSGYISKKLVGFGLVGTTLAWICTFGFVLLPDAPGALQFGYLPIFAYETILAILLLTKKVNERIIKLQSETA